MPTKPNLGELLGPGRFAPGNKAAARRAALAAGDLLRRRSIGREHFRPEIFPTPPDKPEHLLIYPWHPNEERTRHEQGSEGSVARGDHNHDFQYLHIQEAKVNPGNDAGYEEKIVAAADQAHEATTDFSVRQAYWRCLDDDIETGEVTAQITPGKQLVYVEFSKDLGVTYSEPILVGVAPPNARGIAYVADRTFNFDPERGPVTLTRVTIVQANNPHNRLFKAVRSDRTGKIRNGWLNTGHGNGIDADTVDGVHGTDLVLKAAADVTGTLALSGDITPPTITTTQHDYVPTGGDAASTWRVSSDAPRRITGIVGGTDGRILILHNVGGFAITLGDEDAGSAPLNRFAFESDITFGADQSISLRWDATSSRWRWVSAPATAAASSGAGYPPALGHMGF